MRGVWVAAAILLSGCADDAPAAGDMDPADGTYTVSGVVVDQNIRPVAGARVALASSVTNFTGTDGTFVFEDVAEGSHQVTVTAAGYDPQQAVANVGPGLVPLRIQLTQIPLPSGFNQTFAFDGFFEAGTGLAAVVAERLGDDVLNGTACSCVFDVSAAEQVRAFVFEAVWEDNVPRPDTPTQYRWHISAGDPPTTVSAYDPSPIRVEVNGGAFEAGTLLFEVGLEPDAVWPAAQQEFKLAVTLFYGQAPDPGFAVLS